MPDAQPVSPDASSAGRGVGTAGKPPPAPKHRRVLIVDDETLVGIGLAANLEKLGHTVVGHAGSAKEAATMFAQHNPDLVLMDIRLNDEIDGIELAARLYAQRRMPIVIISAFSDDGLNARAAAAGVFGYLTKPVTREALSAQIAVACRRFADTESLRDENITLATTLETRKLVERAKGILMKRLNLDEAAAHKRLQTESQKRRVSISDIAKKVIESEKLLGP